MADRLLTYGVVAGLGYWFGAEPRERWTVVGVLTMVGSLIAVLVYERRLAVDDTAAGRRETAS